MPNLGALQNSAERLFKNNVVLIACSQAYQHSLIRTILLQLGVKATRDTSDGFEAVDAICAFDPCAMILDWGIRGMDAREVVRVVRRSGVVPNSRMPIVAISDPIVKSKVIEAKDLGIDHLLIRPISPMLLQQRLFPALMKTAQPACRLNANSNGLLTSKEVADVLRVSMSWLAKARTRGDGPPYLRVGHAVRYREATLHQWIKSQQT